MYTQTKNIGKLAQGRRIALNNTNRLIEAVKKHDIQSYKL